MQATENCLIHVPQRYLKFIMENQVLYILSVICCSVISKEIPMYLAKNPKY